MDNIEMKHDKESMTIGQTKSINECIEDVSKKLTYLMAYHMDKSLDCQTEFRGMARFHGCMSKRYHDKALHFSKHMNDIYHIKTDKSIHYDDIPFDKGEHLNNWIKLLEKTIKDFERYISFLMQNEEYRIADKVKNFIGYFEDEIFAVERVQRAYAKSNVDYSDIEDKLHKYFEHEYDGNEINFNIGA